MYEKSGYLYPYSFGVAKRSSPQELEACRASHRLNIECAAAINDAINAGFCDNHLNADVARTVIGSYGYDRVNHVLANTLQRLWNDGRFSREHQEWAKDFYIPKDMVSGMDMCREFIVQSHPALLDGFVTLAIKEYQSLGLLGSECCHRDMGQHLGEQVLLVKPTELLDEYKNLENQFFYATGGFGCSPTASGRKVYGKFLADNSSGQFERNDFIGIVRDEFVPQWARDKVAEIKAHQNEVAPTMEQTM